MITMYFQCLCYVCVFMININLTRSAAVSQHVKLHALPIIPAYHRADNKCVKYG